MLTNIDTPRVTIPQRLHDLLLPQAHKRGVSLDKLVERALWSVLLRLIREQTFLSEEKGARP
jgi:hypothetical protein